MSEVNRSHTMWTKSTLATAIISIVLVGSMLTAALSMQNAVTINTAGSLRYPLPSGSSFGVIGSAAQTPGISNFYWLFGNQSISYEVVLPTSVKNLSSIDRFSGLVVWTNQHSGYNATAIKQFALTRVVISHVWDFCNEFYTSLSGSTQTVSTNTVTYVADWGVFKSGVLAEMRNGPTFGTGSLLTVSATSLATFSNVTQIARYDTSRIAFFHMKGQLQDSGFYVLDLGITKPSTEWTGMWHIFPAVKLIQNFPTGKYARWMGNGTDLWDITWINNWITAFVSQNNDITKKSVIGKSVLGRDITAITIGNGNRYAIIDAAIHGNEATPPMAVLRLAELLVEYYRSDTDWQTKLQQYKIILIPVFNPDGYVAETRENANGVDLNRSFPPDGSGTEPETKALMNLMGNFTPTLYVNLHEGGTMYPIDMFYGLYQADPVTSYIRSTLQQANESFIETKNYGWMADIPSLWIGQFHSIARSGLTSSAQAYVSWKYNAATALIESYLWSPTYGSRKSLWAMDYYISTIMSCLEFYDKDSNFIYRSNAFITRTSFASNKLTVQLSSSDLTQQSSTVIGDLAGHGKPVSVSIDGTPRPENQGWSYSAGTVTVTGAETSIVANW